MWHNNVDLICKIIHNTKITYKWTPIVSKTFSCCYQWVWWKEIYYLTRYILRFLENKIVYSLYDHTTRKCKRPIHIFMNVWLFGDHIFQSNLKLERTHRFRCVNCTTGSNCLTKLYRIRNASQGDAIMWFGWKWNWKNVTKTKWNSIGKKWEFVRVRDIVVT